MGVNQGNAMTQCFPPGTLGKREKQILRGFADNIYLSPSAWQQMSLEHINEKSWQVRLGPMLKSFTEKAKLMEYRLKT